MNYQLPKLVVVIAGIIVGQFLLYGPSLCGQKVLLPLEVLALPNAYLPRTAEIARVASVNIYLPDLPYLFEPARRFAVSELRAGRLPMWMPYQYAGAPFIEPKFSPFSVIQFCARSPIVLAWTQMAVALVAGLGAYFFFRRVLGVGFWPATIPAWCYPLTGFFILWQGYPLTLTVCWLPWLLLAVDATVRQTSRFAPIGLSVATCLALVSGHLDMAGQALLASGLFGVWRIADFYRTQWFQRQARMAALSLAAAWMLGLLLASPQILPTLEYTRTGDRMARRSSGSEERPPIGWSALPQTVLPDMYGGYGIWSIGNFRIGKDNQLESSATAYAGLIATLFAAPLAWCSRRHRSANWFWLAAAFFGLSWCLNLPGVVNLLRLPGLNMMSHNRLVFVTSFAILVLAATGLEAISQGALKWRWWLWIGPALLVLLAGWCIYRTHFLPEPVATELAGIIRQGASALWVNNLRGVEWVQAWFTRYYLHAALWCGAGLLAWLVLRLRPAWQTRMLAPVGAILLLDLLSFAYGRNLQCDRALYYPPIPTLDALAKASSGRIIGYNCLPANLASVCGLRDIRGYDGVDPERIVELLMLGADPNSPSPVYARTEFLVPTVAAAPGGDLRLSPVLDLLGVQYVIFRLAPFEGARAAFEGSDYWVMRNPAALPRAFVPRKVELAADKNIRLRKLALPEFDPRTVAYTEAPVHLPAECRGATEIVEETPTHLTLSLHMETAGLVVLADRWDQGWKAWLNGRSVPILIADHALRGVVVPVGEAKLEFRYSPPSFALGLRLAGFAVVLLLGWLALLLFARPNEK